MLCLKHFTKEKILSLKLFHRAYSFHLVLVIHCLFFFLPWLKKKVYYLLFLHFCDISKFLYLIKRNRKKNIQILHRKPLFVFFCFIQRNIHAFNFIFILFWLTYTQRSIKMVKSYLSFLVSFAKWWDQAFSMNRCLLHSKNVGKKEDENKFCILNNGPHYKSKGRLVQLAGAVK